ncbi:MAG: hypothetical protein ACLR7Z_20950 [Bilophila wadsworthia]
MAGFFGTDELAAGRTDLSADSRRDRGEGLRALEAAGEGAVHTE